MSALDALPAQPAISTTLLTRGDVVLERGVLHLLAPDTTPEQARIADLLAVADALEAAGLSPLLIRHDRSVPALVVDENHRRTAVAALHRLARREPLYAKVKGSPALPFADIAGAGTARSLRLFRPRLVGADGLSYGARQGVRVEFWRTSSGLVRAPHVNSLTRRTIAVDDLTFDTVHRYGRSWRTLSGMFDAHPDEFTEDVDMVFSWVDGSSNDFQRQRAAQMAEYVVGEGDDGPARYRHVDELRYALRSVHMYAPWVRRIFIATDSPAPPWLADHPRVTVVRSEEFFADITTLPTHNSHAVEAQLHRIDGLAEHFLYSNDDMFFARPVEPELFFSPSGVTKFVESGTRIGTGPSRVSRSGHDNALRVNRDLLRARFGRVITRDLEHCATPLRRSILAELEHTFPDDFARTAASRFRSASDISVTNSLYHYYALLTGRAVNSTAPRVRYLETTLAASLRRMQRLAGRADIDMFCLNDGASAEVPEQLRVHAIHDVLERMFPVPAPWERAAVTPEPAVAPSAVRSGASRTHVADRRRRTRGGDGPQQRR